MSWNNDYETNDITDDSSPLVIDDRILSTRQNVRTVLAVEHEFDLDDEDNQGKHAAGSARTYVQSSAPDTSGWDSTDQGKIWIKTDDHGQSDEPDNIVGLYVWVWDSSDAEGEWQPYADPTMTGAVCYFLGEPENITTDYPWVPLDGRTLSVASNPEYHRLIEHLAGAGETSVVLPTVNDEYIRVINTPDTSVLNPAAETYTHYDSQIPPHSHGDEAETGDGHVWWNGEWQESTFRDIAHGVLTSTEDVSHRHKVIGHETVQGSGALTAATGDGQTEVTAYTEYSDEGGSTDTEHFHSLDVSKIAHIHKIDIPESDGSEEGKGTDVSVFNDNDEVVPPSMVMLAYIHA